MKLAYVYFYEFVNKDEVYINFIKKSILSLINTNTCCGQDIFINILGVNEDIHSNITNFCENHKVNILDISNGIKHYYDYYKIDISHVNETINNPHVRFYDHKFSNYHEIINRGYDGIVQLDADIIFYDNINYLFETPLLNEFEAIYTMHVPSQYGTYDLERIKSVITDREDNNLPFFSFNKQSGRRYTFLKRFCKYLLNYNLDNFAEDTHKLGFWPSGGMYLFKKDIIEKYSDILSFINYFVTKDDELAILLLSLSKSVQLQTMDMHEVSTFDINTFRSSPGKYKIFHPGGLKQKLDLLQEGLDTF